MGHLGMEAERFDLLIVDARHLLWRSTSVLAAPSAKVRNNGKPFEPLSATMPDGSKVMTGGVYGFLCILHATWKQFGGVPFIAWDGRQGPTERFKIFDNYKHHAERLAAPQDGGDASQRREMMKMIFDGQRVLQELFVHLGIRQAEAPGWEADDVVATLTQYYRNGNSIGILSGDRDLMRLVGCNVKLIRPLKEGKFDVVDDAGVMAAYGVAPDHVCDFKALAGDTGDNIPGAMGIGPKTAAKLLAQHGRWQDVLDWAIANEPTKAWHHALIDCYNDVVMSAKLAALNCHAPLQFIPAKADSQAAFLQMAKYQFKSLLADGRFRELLNMGCQNA